MAVFFLAAFGVFCAAWGFHSRDEMERGLRKLPKNGFTGYVDSWALPVWFLMWTPLIFLMAIQNHVNLYKVAGVLVVELMLLCVYYTLLLCALPLLRRCFSARACATLWTLPNFLYLIGNIYNLDTTSPLLIMTLPKGWLAWILSIWFVGFLLILFHQIISHLLYRRYLLQDAEPVRSTDILSQWHNMQARCNFKHDISIVVSSRTRSPLTIGLLRKKMRLVLPHLNYKPEELTLVLSHELRHIQRGDTTTKMFIGFCTALCWFNPIMWITRRKVSEDLELSCDELVLSDADEATRTQYANLLLSTAGSSRGYTTCLSSAAASLRYRLKNVVMPREVLSGTLLVGLVLGALVLSMGTVALADSPGTVQTQIFNQTPADNHIRNVYFRDEQGPQEIHAYDEAALTDYLTSLPVRQIYYGNFSDSTDPLLEVNYRGTKAGKEVSTLFNLYNGVILAYVPRAEFGRLTQLTYVVDGEIDWNYLRSLLDFDAPDPDPAPQPPWMMMDFRGENYQAKDLMYAQRTVVSAQQNGEAADTRIPGGGSGGIFGAPVTQVQLSFSYAPQQDEYHILVENWDRTESYVVLSDDLTDNILDLAPYSAHYTVSGIFHSTRNTTYEMKFFFDVELP